MQIEYQEKEVNNNKNEEHKGSIIEVYCMERNQFDDCFDFEQDYISGEKRIIFSFCFSYNEKDIEHIYNSLNEKRKEIQVRIGGPNKIKFRIKNKNI